MSPGHWHKAKRSEGLRCDVVLPPDGLPLRDASVRGTLWIRGRMALRRAAQDLPSPPPPMDPTVRADLSAYYAEGNQRLRDLTGLALASWS